MLALGIGGNTAIFTVVNAVLLKPLFPSPATYLVDGKQYVTIAAESDVFTFGLFDAQ